MLVGDADPRGEVEFEGDASIARGEPVDRRAVFFRKAALAAPLPSATAFARDCSSSRRCCSAATFMALSLTFCCLSNRRCFSFAFLSANAKSRRTFRSSAARSRRSRRVIPANLLFGIGGVVAAAVLAAAEAPSPTAPCPGPAFRVTAAGELRCELAALAGDRADWVPASWGELLLLGTLATAISSAVFFMSSNFCAK